MSASATKGCSRRMGHAHEHPAAASLGQFPISLGPISRQPLARQSLGNS
ncbi:hypothetical protein GFS31_31940 [Leptolyngbya sp. BL0902]|nr:hypothetical protein GFS31_31940 [Leptolyngbya sp. BL0902]